MFLGTPILCVKTRLWNIGGAAIAVECAQTVTIIAIMSLLLQLLFQLYAWQDETDRPGYQRIGQSTSSCPATRGPQVQDLDEPAIIRIMDIISIIRIIDIIRIICIICITLSLGVRRCYSDR